VATRVVIADDNYLVREGLVQLLGGVPGLTIIAACEDYDGALAAAESERPDVVVTDIRMPPTRPTRASVSPVRSGRAHRGSASSC